MVGLVKHVPVVLVAIPILYSVQTLNVGATEPVAPQDQKASFMEPITSNGSADWTNRVVRATGFGFPPKDAANPLHAKMMAQRAAQSVALRNLLETLRGVRVDSHTTVENYIVKSDE